MTNKNKSQKNNELNNQQIEEEIIFDEENQENSIFGKKSDEKMKKEIQKLKAEKKEYLDGWQRARAEIANLKKQHSEEKKVFTTLGKETLLLDILPILDNFTAAFSNQEAWEKVDKNWRTGIEYIYQQFLEKLENNGIEQIGKIGEKFDEKIHSGIENITTTDKTKDHTIAQVIQPGYKLGEKIIREAKVKVFVL